MFFFFYLKFHICYHIFIIYYKEQVCVKARENHANCCKALEKLASSVMRSAGKHASRLSKPLHSAGKTCKLCYALENQAVSRRMGKRIIFIFNAVSFFILTRKIKVKNVS